jgi:hypothetical protein
MTRLEQLSELDRLRAELHAMPDMRACGSYGRAVCDAYETKVRAEIRQLESTLEVAVWRVTFRRGPDGSESTESAQLARFADPRLADKYARRLAGHEAVFVRASHDDYYFEVREPMDLDSAVLRTTQYRVCR